MLSAQKRSQRVTRVEHGPSIIYFITDRKGEKLDTEYSVVPSPAKPLGLLPTFP